MNNKIKNAYSDIKMSAEVEEKILNMTVNRKEKRRRKYKFAYASCIAIVVCCLSLPIIYAMQVTKEYNAAIGYLQSLGIEVEDLSSYSKKEIIRVYDAYKAGENNEILNKLLENDVDKTTKNLLSVTSADIEKLQPNMTYKDVINMLGDTIDVGSGIYILNYKVDDKYILSIPFTSLESELGVYGKDLLKALQPIE